MTTDDRLKCYEGNDLLACWDCTYCDNLVTDGDPPFVAKRLTIECKKGHVLELVRITKHSDGEDSQ